MPGNSIREFLAWLDIIPGRHWLVLGDSGELPDAIRAECKPSGVTIAEALALPYPDGAFDVAVLLGAPSLQVLQEMRRVIFPSGIVGVLSAAGPPFEDVLRQAGLHAVQSSAFETFIFARGAR